MSTLVVVRKGNKGVIASDSLFNRGTLKVPANHKVNANKIYRIEDAFIGFVGWTAMSNIFEHIPEKYPKHLNFNSRKDLFKTFLFLHSKLKAEYFIETKEKDDQPVESSQWDCLILSPTGIYSVQSYREAVEFDKYWAEGSGLRLALGAMHAVYEIYEDPKQIAEAAIRAASEFDDATASPAQIFELRMRGKK